MLQSVLQCSELSILTPCGQLSSTLEFVFFTVLTVKVRVAVCVAVRVAMSRYRHSM